LKFLRQAPSWLANYFAVNKLAWNLFSISGDSTNIQPRKRLPMSASDTGIFLSVVIPAYNEELRLPKTLTAVIDYLQRQSYSWEVTVVDDGSSDRTVQIVESAYPGDSRIRLLEYDVRGNRGKGYAVRWGMQHVGGRYRLFMDADNSTTIDHFEQFLPFFEAGNEVVIGSRAAQGADITVRQARWKEFLGVLGNRWIRLWAVPGIQDTQAGFKVFTGRAADDVFPRLTVDRWGFDVEALAVARRQGYKIAERPIHWENDTNTKVRFTTYLEVLMEVVKIRWNIWKGVYNKPRK
jgi:dolichyl-phosphate beta-glucosyltransferase